MTTRRAQRLGFFSMVAAVSDSFVQATAADVSAVIDAALATVGEFYQADRSYVFLFSDDLQTASNTHEWCAVGVNPQKEHLQNLSSATFGGWYQQWHAGQASVIDDVAQLAPESAEYQLLAAQGIQSLLMLPLKVQGRLIGMFGIDIVRAVQAWQEEQIAGLALIAGNIGSALQRQKIELAAERLAWFDTVTGLANRQLMEDRIQQAQWQCVRAGRYAALLCLNLEDFKTLNESLGYSAGNNVLKCMGSLLQSALPVGDTLGRLNADNFLILIEMLPPNRHAAMKILTDLSARLHSIIAHDNTLCKLRPKNRLRIGANLFMNAEHTVDTLITQAEIAMRQAKNIPAQLLFFDCDMQQQSYRRLQLDNELRTALRVQQFVLYFQPQFAHPNNMTGAEVLLRWQHPQQGLLSPHAFMPFAEESGLIVPIGMWVLHQACLQLALWQHMPDKQHLTLSVNISARQFRQPEFITEVIDIVMQTGINPRRLTLEITESMLIDDIEETVFIMQALAKMGVRFALDDFGTGYSSLVYLQKLPFHQLKIDRGFVLDIVTSEQHRAIIRAIIMLGESLGLTVLAEGVETISQLEALLSLGCHYYQGYFSGRPMPLQALETRYSNAYIAE